METCLTPYLPAKAKVRPNKNCVSDNHLKKTGRKSTDLLLFSRFFTMKKRHFGLKFYIKTYKKQQSCRVAVIFLLGRVTRSTPIIFYYFRPNTFCELPATAKQSLMVAVWDSFNDISWGRLEWQKLFTIKFSYLIVIFIIIIYIQIIIADILIICLNYD